MPLDNFSRARIHHSRSIRPATRRTMHPLNHVVTQVHQVRAFRQQLHAKRIFVSRRFERLIPPPCSFKQCRANRLRRAAIQVVHNRLNRLTHRRSGISFLQPVPCSEPLHDRLAHRRRIIHIRNAIKTRTRIVGTDLVTRWRQLYERVMLAHCNRRRIRRYILHPFSRLITGERERRFHFRVQWKILRVRQINRASRAIQFVRALFRSFQRCRHTMRVAQIKIRRVHQQMTVFFRCSAKSPDHRLRK